MITEINNINIIVPETGLCVSCMQPFVELDRTEPYKWQEDKKNQQLNRISRFMNIAKQYGGNGKSHFTLLPEYSIPGIEGIEKINQFLADSSWPSETIVIGGIDGLNKNEYNTACNKPNSVVHPSNKPDQVADDKWVNCCITWVKDTNGNIKQWIQPKISPSWPEKAITHSEMFCGHSVNLFTIKFANNTECKFLSLICFDWIGTINGTGNGIFEILNQVNRLWRTNGDSQPKDINLIFILQCNNEPNHRNFLSNACNFFEDRTTNPLIGRDHSVLVFANTAGKNIPGKTNEYGYSSLIASFLSPYENRECCPLSFSSETLKLRNSTNHGRCKEALFRENGACFHLLKFRPPRWISGGPGNRCLFLEEAKVYSIDEGIDYPRVPGSPVEASIKWINDEIDTVEPITLHEDRNPIRGEVITSHENVSRELRKASGEYLCRYIQYSFCKYNNINQDITPIIHYVDRWDEGERVGIQVVIHTLSIIGTCNAITISGSIAHATMTIGTNVVDIIVVHGGNTHEECFRYSKEFHNSPSRYSIVVTKDFHDTPLNEKIEGLIFKTQEPVSEKGPNITNPDDCFIHCGYQNIKSCCFSALSTDNLKEQLNNLWGVQT